MAEQKQQEKIEIEYKKDDHIAFIINEETLTGTIRWIGEGDKWDKGIWYGVELDVENLVYGHDGSYNQERYFGCADKHGVYIRKNQIQKISDANKDNNNKDDKNEKK